MKRKIQGVFCLASKDGNRIFGLGIDRLTGEDILVYRGTKSKVNLTMEQYSKYITKVICGEVSYSSKMIYLAGTHKKQAVIGAVKFDSTLKTLKFSVLHQSVPEVSSMQRILGTDLLLVGCPTALMILKLDKETSTFSILNSYENLNCRRLTTQLFFEKFLYAFGSQKFFKFEYNRALDHKTFYDMEHCWMDRKTQKKEDTN